MGVLFSQEQLRKTGSRLSNPTPSFTLFHYAANNKVHIVFVGAPPSRLILQFKQEKKVFVPIQQHMMQRCMAMEQLTAYHHLGRK